MSREHNGDYRAKHPTNSSVDPALADAVSMGIIQGRISCKSAFAIATTTSVSPANVGQAIDMQQGRITACQLGLFGHGETDAPEDEDHQPKEDLKTAIHGALDQGRLPCSRAWQIADESKISRLGVSRVCDSLGIRISQCQLGAF